MIGSGVAASLYPLDLLMQYRQTMSKSFQFPLPPKKMPRPSFLKTVNYIRSKRATLQASLRQGISYGAARTLARGYVSSAHGAILKNASLNQRGKLSELFPEERLGENLDDNSGQPSARRINLAHAAGIATVIGFVDTSLTHKHANERGLRFHEFFLQQKGVHYQAPVPATFAQHFNLFSVGYALRLSRNIVSVGGLLVTPHIENSLKFMPLSDKERTLVAATASGAVAGIIGNTLEVGYKNQLIAVRPNFTTPPAYEIFAKLVAQGGLKAMTKGWAVAVIYTGVAYNVIPYIEDLAAKAVPVAEKSLSDGYDAVSANSQAAYLRTAGFFSRKPKSTNQENTPVPTLNPEEIKKQEQDNKKPSPKL